MKTTLAAVRFLALACFALAGEKVSDAAIKQRLLGYWKSPRHGYLITGGMLGTDVSTRMEVHVKL
jgi:hypothetical protein